MDEVLETLIANNRGRTNGDLPMRYMGSDTRERKALTALNIMIEKRFGKDSRMDYINGVLGTWLESSLELTVAQVYSLLKYTQGKQNDISKQF